MLGSEDIPQHQRQRANCDCRRGLQCDLHADCDHQGNCYASLCTPSRILQGREAVERLERAFDKLTADYREAITLCRLVKLPYPEIAAAMGRLATSCTVASRG